MGYTIEMSEKQETTPHVPDDREDSAGPDKPAGIDKEGPPAQIPDDRKGATKPATPPTNDPSDPEQGDQ